jgi:hypothetical protein
MWLAAGMITTPFTDRAKCEQQQGVNEQPDQQEQ